MTKWIRPIIWLFVRPVLALTVGILVRRPEALPKDGPAILLANRAGPLTPLVLTAILPWWLLLSLRDVETKDESRGYFDRFVAFLTNRVILVPLKTGEPALAALQETIETGGVLMFTLDAESDETTLRLIQEAVITLGEQNPKMPIVPVYVWGFDVVGRWEGRWLPRFGDVLVGDRMQGNMTHSVFVSVLGDRTSALAREGERLAQLTSR